MVKIKNEKIRNTTGSKDVGYIMKKAEFGYAGHMMRSDKEKLSRRLYKWTPYGFKRKKGRPKVRWKEKLQKGQE